MDKYILILVISIFFGCEIINPSEEIPSFVNIASVEVSPSSFGSTKHNIEHIWLYADGRLRGGWFLPAQIPIFTSETPIEIEIFPGIRDNGIQSTPEIYPFLESWKTPVMLISGQKQDLNPIFKYKRKADLVLIEDFEKEEQLFSQHTFDSIIIETTDVLEGNKSGKIIVQKKSETEISNDQAILGLPSDGSPVYVEMHYKSTVELNVGLVGHISGNSIKQYKLVLLPSEDWKKIYINFTNNIVESGFEGYQLIFRIQNVTEQESITLLDNIKWLHL